MIHRVDKLKSKMEEANIDAFLVTSPFNLRYISGFTGTAGTAVITKHNAYFITDFRYTEQAIAQCQGYEIVLDSRTHNLSTYDLINKLLQKEQLTTLAFEENFVTFSAFDALADAMDLDLIPVSGMIEELREIKEAAEIEKIKKACEIADKGFLHVLDFIKPGMSEIQVANEVDFFMRSLGASGVSFETIVASGVRSAMPHGVASDKIIEKNDLITLDFGCYYDGYVSDMTRTFAIGDPGEKLKEIYQWVLEAQLMVNKVAKPGMTGIELDAVARDFFATKKVADAFGHSLGHGIGLEVHEGPNVSRLAKKAFVPGNVITNEPGLYFVGLGGVRIEDDLLVTNNGVEILTHAPKELIIL